MFQYFQKTKCKFGREEETMLDASLGLNEKGGMDDNEFELYLKNLMEMIYPDAMDTPGKRVIVKIDSGPGRSNMDLLARLRMRGVILYPGVPNTTSVSQETDRNYGLFKSVYRENIENFAANCEKAGKSTSASVALIGLFVFGGKDPLTSDEYKNAFQAAFCKEKNLSAWSKVGAAPLTRACLYDEQVRHELGGDEEDPMADEFRKIQEKNNHSVYMLNLNGYKGNMLKATIKEKATAEQVSTASVDVTQPYSKTQLQALSEATTHGQKFLLTHGLHLTSDMAFKAAELANRKRKCEELELEKKKRKMQEKRRDEGRLVLEKNKTVEQMNDSDLKKLLAWYQVQPKMTKTIAERRAKWKEIVEKKQKEPPFQLWTLEDETKLNMLKSDDVDIKETQLGRAREINKLEFESNYKNMSKEERQVMLSKLKRIDDDEIEVEEV